MEGGLARVHLARMAVVIEGVDDRDGRVVAQLRNSLESRTTMNASFFSRRKNGGLQM